MVVPETNDSLNVRRLGRRRNFNDFLVIRRQLAHLGWGDARARIWKRCKEKRWKEGERNVRLVNTTSYIKEDSDSEAVEASEETRMRARHKRFFG